MSKNEYKIIKDFLDKEDLLFDTLTITIGLVGINDNSDDLSQKYRVGKIEASSEGKNDKFIKIRKFIQELNKEVSNKLNTGFKTSDKNSGWSIFFLIKECIQILSSDEFHFNYYRGQRRGEWKTIPSAFRDLVNIHGDLYSDEFEDIYKEIHRKFPEKIEYVEFPQMRRSDECSRIMQARGQQLALLQHYELHTALLDITSNPFVALLFMTNGDMDDPKLEFYDVSDTKLFMEPEKTELNNRILAQKGAFLNFEMLVSKVKRNTSLIDVLKNDDNKMQIPRVVLEIKYLEKDTEAENKKQSAINEKLGKNKNTESLAKEYGNGFPVDRDKIFQDVKEKLRKKLSEFKYNEDDLFPDFEDFLKNRMKLFDKPE